jgi:Leucine-rich repeat (LRR) protein
VGLRSLRLLDVSHNALTALSTSLRTLYLLESLDVSHNQLVDLAATDLSHPFLMHLNASHNRIPVLPTALSQMTALTRLDMRCNRLSSVPPGVLSSLLYLNVLLVSGNALTGLDTIEFGQMPELAEFDVRVCPSVCLSLVFTFQLLSVLLTRCQAARNALVSLPDTLSQATSLTSLNLSGNLIEVLPSSLSELHSLAVVDVSQNRITDCMCVPAACGVVKF